MCVCVRGILEWWKLETKQQKQGNAEIMINLSGKK